MMPVDSQDKQMNKVLFEQTFSRWTHQVRSITVQNHDPNAQNVWITYLHERWTNDHIQGEMSW